MFWDFEVLAIRNPIDPSWFSGNTPSWDPGPPCKKTNHNLLKRLWGMAWDDMKKGSPGSAWPSCTMEQGPVGLLGTQPFCVPYFLFLGNKLQPPWLSLGSKDRFRQLLIKKGRGHHGREEPSRENGAGSSHCGSVERNLKSIHEDVGSIPGLTQWVWDLVLLWAVV